MRQRQRWEGPRPRRDEMRVARQFTAWDTTKTQIPSRREGMIVSHRVFSIRGARAMRRLVCRSHRLYGTELDFNRYQALRTWLPSFSPYGTDRLLSHPRQ